MRGALPGAAPLSCQWTCADERCYPDLDALNLPGRHPTFGELWRGVLWRFWDESEHLTDVGVMGVVPVATHDDKPPLVWILWPTHGLGPCVEVLRDGFTG